MQASSITDPHPQYQYLIHLNPIFITSTTTKMRFTSTLAALILGFATTQILALPTPQIAGEGAACNSILSSTDNGVVYGTENAEDNTANTVSSVTKGTRRRRQIAGEGAACDSVLTSTDNGVGYGVENAEDNTANTVSSTTKGARRRQLDKISKGAGTLGDAAGAGAVADPAAAEGESLDGTLTGDAANAGAQVGNTEASTLEQAGSDVPKARRQLDKISKGAGDLGDAAGAGAVADPAAAEGESLDGTLTGDAANAGAQVGNTEASTLEQAGSDVPKF